MSEAAKRTTRAKVPPPHKPLSDWGTFLEWCRANGRKVNIDSLIAFRSKEQDYCEGCHELTDLHREGCTNPNCDKDFHRVCLGCLPEDVCDG